MVGSYGWSVFGWFTQGQADATEESRQWARRRQTNDFRTMAISTKDRCDKFGDGTPMKHVMAEISNDDIEQILKVNNIELVDGETKNQTA